MNDPDQASDRVPLRSWYALFVLILLYAVSMIDRTIISMLIGPIKLDLALDDFRASLLMGTAFGICYVLFATPFGWAADRFPRPRVLAFGLAFWSLACMTCGLTTTFIGLILARMAVGAGEACLSPTAYPLLSDLFRGRHLPRAMAIYHFAGTLGASIAMLVGGLVASMASRTGGLDLPLLGELRSWQLAFIAVGLPGLPLILLALTIPEPRGALPARVEEKSAEPSAIPFMSRHRRLIVCHFAGFALAVMLGYGKSFWMPEFLMRTFHWDVAYVGTLLAVLTVISALLGQVLAVRVIEFLARRGYEDATIRGFIYTSVAGIGATVMAFATLNPAVTVAGIFLAHMTTVSALTYGSSSLQQFAPPRLRGRLFGSFVSLISLIGLGAGPALIGIVSTNLTSGAGQLRFAILIVVVVSQIAVIALLSCGLKSFMEARREL